MSPELADAPAAPGTRLVLRLYVAGDGPNSTAARLNLKQLLGSRRAQDCEVEIVDCLREPLRAIQEGVFVTPTLLRISPAPRRTIVGSLSATSQVSHALGFGLDTSAPAEPRGTNGKR